MFSRMEKKIARYRRAIWLGTCTFSGVLSPDRYPASRGPSIFLEIDRRVPDRSLEVKVLEVKFPNLYKEILSCINRQ